MKKILTYLAIFLFSFTGMANAEWIGCDIPDAGENVVSSIVVVDGGPEIVTPYQLNSAGDAVLLLDIENIDSCSVVAYFENDQGRRSLASVPFVLKARPSVSIGHRIVRE
jgi:hypothetical protein